jgi:hypothetical protein
MGRDDTCKAFKVSFPSLHRGYIGAIDGYTHREVSKFLEFP